MVSFTHKSLGWCTCFNKQASSFKKIHFGGAKNSAYITFLLIGTFDLLYHLQQFIDPFQFCWKAWHHDFQTNKSSVWYCVSTKVNQSFCKFGTNKNKKIDKKSTLGRKGSVKAFLFTWGQIKIVIHTKQVIPGSLELLVKGNVFLN